MLNIFFFLLKYLTEGPLPNNAIFLLSVINFEIDISFIIYAGKVYILSNFFSQLFPIFLNLFYYQYQSQFLLEL